MERALRKNWLEIEQDLKCINNWIYYSECFPYWYWRNREELCRGLWSHNRNWSDYEFDSRFNQFKNETIIRLARYLKEYHKDY